MAASVTGSGFEGGEERMFAYVGGYTTADRNGHGDGIHVTFNQHREILPAQCVLRAI